MLCEEYGSCLLRVVSSRLPLSSQQLLTALIGSSGLSRLERAPSCDGLDRRRSHQTRNREEKRTESYEEVASLS